MAQRTVQRQTQRTSSSTYITPKAERDAHYFIDRFYGSEAAYLDACSAAGMTDEHRWRFERYGVILQPVQIPFAVLARQARLPDGPDELLFGGAQGGSKSFTVSAVVMLDDCMCFAGLKVLYLRKTGRAAIEQLDDLSRFILRHVPRSIVTPLVTRIDYANGSRIVIGGFKDDAQAQSYQGFEYDIKVIEEATQLSKKTHETLNKNRRSSKVFDGVVWKPHDYNTTNPLGIGHAYIKQRFVDNERKRARGELYNPRHRFVFATVDDNKAINPEYVQVLDELTGAEYRAYRLGDWDVSAGAYFEAWNEAIHVIPPLSDLSYMREVWCALDFGYNHPNVVQLAARDGDGIVYVVDELVHRRRQPEEIAPDIQTMLAQYGLTRDDLSCFLVGSDAFSQTGRARLTVAQQYEQLGIPMSRAYTDAGSRVAGALYLSKLLGSAERGIQPMLYVTSRCNRLRETLPYLERDPNNAEDVLKVDADDKGNGGDDSYDCCRYLVYRPHTTTITIG